MQIVRKEKGIGHGKDEQESEDFFKSGNIYVNNMEFDLNMNETLVVSSNK